MRRKFSLDFLKTFLSFKKNDQVQKQYGKIGRRGKKKQAENKLPFIYLCVAGQITLCSGPRYSHLKTWELDQIPEPGLE